MIERMKDAIEDLRLEISSLEESSQKYLKDIHAIMMELFEKVDEIHQRVGKLSKEQEET